MLPECAGHVNSKLQPLCLQVATRMYGFPARHDNDEPHMQMLPVFEMVKALHSSPRAKIGLKRSMLIPCANRLPQPHLCASCCAVQAHCRKTNNYFGPFICWPLAYSCRRKLPEVPQFTCSAAA